MFWSVIIIQFVSFANLICPPQLPVTLAATQLKPTNLRATKKNKIFIIQKSKFLIFRKWKCGSRLAELSSSAGANLFFGTLEKNIACETALISQYWTLFLVFMLLSFCIFVFLSRHHSDQMSEGFQMSEATLCVQILKWQSVSHSQG